MMQLDVDDTTQRLLDMLLARLDDEPDVPDVDVHSGAQLHEIARAHDEWDRLRSALSLLIASRLLRQAVETARERHPEG